jgi:hypothetical protein
MRMKKQKKLRCLRMSQPVAWMQIFASMCSHVPNKNEQMVRYYGHFRKVCRYDPDYPIETYAS